MSLMPDIYAKKILIAETEPELLKNISTVLSGAGYATTSVLDPAIILSEIVRLKPDVLILDTVLGGTSGFDVLAAIRAHGDHMVSSVPVVIASQTGDISEISNGIHLGIADYFVRSSVTSDILLGKLAKIAGPATKAVSAGQTAASAATASTSSGQIKLLIVEDDKFLRDLAAQKLSKAGLNVVTAADGEQGHATAEKEVPDIMLLDILLPGIDGFEVLKRIRANPALNHTRIAMLSNFGQREDIEKALNGGAEQFFIKANYTLDEIVDEVKKMLANPRK
jgi:DNA-binding response OmpR family regulator